MDELFKSLEETKTEFWKNHESRMEELNTAISKINTTAKDVEIDRDLEEISKELDTLLAEF